MKVKAILSGFTLIEVVISLAFAVGILLMATQAFRVITTSMSVVGRLNTENSLMRTGFWVAMDSVDYWYMEAESEFPYYKIHNRHGRAPEDERKRWFAPVVYSGNMRNNEFLEAPATSPMPGLHYRLAQNPNVFLPHDPRSYYRNGLYGRERPSIMEVDGGKDPKSPHKSSGLDRIQSWGNGKLFNDAAYVTPKHLFGDYGLHQATDMSDDGWEGRFQEIDWYNGLDGRVPSDDDGDGVPDWEIDQVKNAEVWNTGFDGRMDWSEEVVLTSRPRSFWQLHQRLGHFGAALYMPAGMPWLILDQYGCFPRADSWPTYTGPAGNDLPDLDDPFESCNSYLAGSESRDIQPIVTGNELIDFLAPGARDWTRCVVDRRGGGYCSPFVVKPHRAPAYLSGEWKVEDKLKHIFDDESGSYGARALNKDMYFLYAPFKSTTYGNSLITADDGYGGTSDRIVNPLKHSALTSEISLLPGGVADQWHESTVEIHGSVDSLPEELAAKYGKQASEWRTRLARQVLDMDTARRSSLTLRMIRYFMYDGSLLTIATVVVTDPETGKELSLNVMPLGTTYRGARQHWAEQHANRVQGSSAPWASRDRFGNAPIGDYYAVSP